MNLRTEARRLSTVASVFVGIGWFFVVYTLIAGVVWWIQLAQKPAFDFLESFGLSASAIGGPLFLALVVAAVGHFLRLFSMWAVSQSNA